MEKTITLFKKSFRQFKERGMILLALGAFASVTASAQYTQPVHYYGCQWNSGVTQNMYSSIDEVIVEDSDGNILYYKGADGCNNEPSGTNIGHFNLMTTTPSFTLTAGSSYKITVGTSHPSTYTGYTSAIAVWFDFNGNKSFGDADEYVSPSGFMVSHQSTNSFTFTVPCNVTTTGTSRMRVRSNYQFQPWTSSMHSTSGTAVYYGETEDYTCDYDKPSVTNASFFIPDTAYIGTIVKGVNNSSLAHINEWDINDNGIVNYTTRNFEHIFNSTGTYKIKLFIENCAGKDSIVKKIVIISPTAVPVADFVSDKNVVELFDVVKMIDLSTNGATYWDWYFTDGIDTIDGADLSVLQGNDPYVNKDPEVFTGTNAPGFPKIFPDRGEWTVCLRASNSLGTSALKCKTNYIQVNKTSFNIGPETLLPDNIISATEGVLFDKGGPDNDYTVPESNLEALIAPCGAESVTVVFKQFKLLSNANLKIYDGVNALGIPLHTGSGFTEGNEPKGPITANTGTMYFLWNSTSGPQDSGFIANWSSVEGSGAAPVANIEMPADSVFNGVGHDYMNTSSDAEGNIRFMWYVDGVFISESRHLINYLFTSNGNHTVRLKVLNCDGTSSDVTKIIWVKDASSSPTEIDFTVDNERPRVGETIVFTALSNNANRWEWNVFPNTGVNAIAPVVNALKVRSFEFTQAGKYTIQCHAYNSVDSINSENSAIKANYIVVVEHCVPVVSVTTSTDIGISKFVFTEAATGDVFINNKTATGVPYEDFTEDVIDLNFGGTYDFEISRSSNVNNMTRKIWVDWNVDGDFDDAGEEVASQASGNSMIWTGSITVPNASMAFNANTVMRIGVSYGTDANEPCGANSGISGANRIGEFEDYGIRVVNDGDVPVITLIGSDTVYVEQNSIYVDAGATAWDPSQGDITADIVSTDDVEESFTGIYSVVYCVEDASGNKAECVKRIVYVVVDQTPPELTLNGSATETIEVGTPWTDAGATANDIKDGNLDAAIVVTGTVDVNILGVYLVTYYVQDAQGNSSQLVRTINVVDTEAPVIDNASADKITDPSAWLVETQLEDVFIDVTSFSDNYNNVGNNLTINVNPGFGMEAIVDTRFKGTTSVTYTATDESGNVTIQVIKYVIEDYIAPIIDLHTLDTVWHEVNTDYSPVDATASDNFYDKTQISLSMTTNVNPFLLGSYEDVYTAIDASGNVSVRIRTVNVVDTKAPTISGKNGSILRVGLYSEFAAVERLVFQDNYDSPADIKANVELLFTDINTYKEGLYTATFQTVDNSGNLSAPFTLYILVSNTEIKLGVEDLDLAELMTVSPNPTTGVFSINIDLPGNEAISVAIYNTMGQKVQDVVDASITNGSYVVDLSNHADGFYYVKMVIRGTVITKKVMINQ